LASSVLPTPVGPRNRKDPTGPAGIAHAGAAAAHGARHGGDRVVLPDHAGVQVVEVGQALALALRDRLTGMPVARAITAAISARRRPPTRVAARRAGVVDPRLHRGDLVADPRGLLVVLGADGGVLARLEVGELGEQRRDVGDDAERRRSRAPA
jgi:hypothetical protein